MLISKLKQKKNIKQNLTDQRPSCDGGHVLDGHW